MTSAALQRTEVQRGGAQDTEASLQRCRAQSVKAALQGAGHRGAAQIDGSHGETARAVGDTYGDTAGHL